MIRYKKVRLCGGRGRPARPGNSSSPPPRIATASSGRTDIQVSLPKYCTGPRVELVPRLYMHTSRCTVGVKATAPCNTFGTALCRVRQDELQTFCQRQRNSVCANRKYNISANANLRY